MQTRLVDAAPSTDDLLIEKLQSLRWPLQPGETIRVGIEDAQGRLYRVIETSSVVEAVHVFELLHELGLVAREPGGDGSLTRIYRGEG
ncbi:hypothetical protein [Azohydromonas caseinilytica]|uniref:Uncharacterized protein n=1 Tax=Azohydromonas caseinilytica TaxID=2728836 RepID=A0A848FBS4_9BURK|nr:hypothetical protein [Azohydromonas caseinilytica]NML17647.1 hypothetical protein [Azohydromonas caseinilytica]